MPWNFFDSIDTEEKAYWLGMLYADGCVLKSPHDYRVSLCLKETDSEHVEKLAKIFMRRARSSSGMSRCVIGSKYLCLTLCGHGLIPNKEHQDCTRVFDAVPLNFRRHFVRGVFDGDGSIFKAKNVRMTITGNIFTCTRLSKVAATEASVTQTTISKHTRCKSTYEIRWEGLKKCQEFGTWLYSNSTVYLPRKFQRWTDLCG